MTKASRIILWVLILACVRLPFQQANTTHAERAVVPEFQASVPANVLAEFDGTLGSSSVTLPCTLSFTNKSIDPQNMPWRVDLTWFKREFGQTQTTNLYIWENNYDDKIDRNETRMCRVKDPFEERYNLRFDDVKAEDEGEYCCYLHINTHPSSTACTNLHYKAFQDDVEHHFIMDCDASPDDDNPRTTTVQCPAPGSPIPPMNVQIKNFYPDSIQSEGRMVELYAPAKDSFNPISTVAWTDFINNADGTFSVNFTSNWDPEEYNCDTLGTVTFLISLTHKLKGDEAYHTCTWIPVPTTEPPPPTEPPPTTEPPPITEPPTTTEDTEPTTGPDDEPHHEEGGLSTAETVCAVVFPCAGVVGLIWWLVKKFCCNSQGKGDVKINICNCCNHHHNDPHPQPAESPVPDAKPSANPGSDLPPPYSRTPKTTQAKQRNDTVN